MHGKRFIMPEDQQVEEEQAEEGAPEQIGAEDAGEEVTEFPEEVEIQMGDAPQEVLDKLGPVCTLAEQNYIQVAGLIKEMQGAESVLQKFHSHEEGVTSSDLQMAKDNYDNAKASYIDLGNQINKGMRQVHASARRFPEDLLIQNIYKAYLAKLLASLEARNPIQNFVALVAGGEFDLERRTGSLTGNEDQSAAEAYRKREMEQTEHQIVMLEVRYQKRQLANRLRQGDSRKKVIMRLVHLIHRDPVDVNSYVWMAHLLTDQLSSERNQNERVHMRDEILDYCKKGIAVIDDYMNLQGIESLNDRDRMRAEYVKSITAIRRPLLKN